MTVHSILQSLPKYYLNDINCNDETNVTIAALMVVTVVDVVSTMNSVQIGNVTLEILLVIVLFLKRMEMVGFKIH